MNTLKIFLFLFLFVKSNFIYSQFYEEIKESAEDYLLALSKNSKYSDEKFLILNSTLFSSIDEETLSNLYLISEREIDSLRASLAEFENEKHNISIDSAFVLFNYWYLHFSNTFYNYAEEKFFSSEKEKIILFSTSMSCYCTLEMCRRQTAQLIDLCRFYQIDYWIIDSYENNDLQIKYETLFAPSVILFDENNNPVLKIQYDEEMISKLVNFFNNKNFEQMKG